MTRLKGASAPATSSGIKHPSGVNPTVQPTASSSGMNPNENMLLLADEFITKNSQLTFEQRQSIVEEVNLEGVEPKHAKAILESVEKALIIQQKGFGLRQDGGARVRPPTAFDKYYDTVKTFQTRKEAIESFKRQTEASQAQQADRSRQLQSKRLNLNTVSIEDFETVMPNLPKPTVNQIMQARAKGPFADWKAVAGVHGVGDKVLQNLKTYFNTPGIVDPVQEDEPVERSGKRSHQVNIATTVTRQVLLARQKLKPGKLWSDTGCMKPVAHREVHKLQIAELKKYGLKSVLVRKTDEFQFGDGEITVSKFGYMYRVIFQKIDRGHMFQASVDVPCPSLLAMGP